MQRSIPYRNFIIQELRRENLPPELLFLPVIESGFSPKAVSKSGAVGIWQFMRNSIGGYDIHIDEWMDERRDPWKTSAAAVKKLKWNYNYYNDWYLALAAYNCGVGALDKAIKKAGSRNYWYLAEKKFLKPETSLYVAKFLAIAEILMNSEKYGIDWGEALDYEATELIPIKRSVDIILLAEKVKADTDLFSALNPSLKFNITPPNVKYNLRIPMEHKEAVQDLLAKNTLLIKYYSYKIRSGDTLYALSRHYGVSIKSIINYNPGIKASALRIGQVLRIPALKTVNSYRRKKDDQNVEFNGVYIIQKGDTLWSIALKHDVQVETLAAKNGIEVNSVLSLGQKLKVPIIN
nr:transglycosylase SLT domain-containing protein [Treponema sp. OMZ 792]